MGCKSCFIILQVIFLLGGNDVFDAMVAHIMH